MMATRLNLYWRGALCLCAGVVALAAGCSAHPPNTVPSTAPPASLDASVRALPDAPGGRDFRAIRRYPGSWIAQPHDTFYVFCPDIQATYRDFRVDYETTDADGDRIVEFFKGELRRSGSYRVVFSDSSGSGDAAVWRVDFRRSNATLMCRASLSDDDARDAYGGDVRLTVARQASGPTSIQLEVLLNLRADSPY